jgi:repressor LexA
MTKELTNRQKEILDFIAKSIEEKNYPPTIIEICNHFKIASTNAVSQTLSVLEKKGYIKRLKGASRSIIITDTKKDNNVLPENIRFVNILGEGSSDNPYSVFISSKSQIAVDVNFLSEKDNLFAAYIQDDGMSNSGILCGDLLIAHQTTNFSNNDMVLVLFGNKIIARKLSIDGNNIEAVALSKSYPAIAIKNNIAIILGKIIGLNRKI